MQGSKDTHKYLVCNEVFSDNDDGIILKSTSSPLSNWSIAEEIKRLIDINTVIPIEPEYTFHKEDCVSSQANPFDNPIAFYKR